MTDPLLLPLDGTRVAEASAGTGKTFAIATLYLRLIVERGLRPDEIVVATFTRAAAAELSGRLRARLELAAQLLRDDDPAAPRPGEDGAPAEIRRTFAQALQQGVSSADLHKRVREARTMQDTALIGTLHGFCFRALSEFGFAAGQVLSQPELIEDVRALELEVVRDFWRRGSADAARAGLLADTWGSPEALAAQVCAARWGNLPAGSIPQPARPDTAALEARLAASRAAIANWSDAGLVDADQSIGRAFSHGSARKPRSTALRTLRDWARADPDEAADVAVNVEVCRFDPAECSSKASFVAQPEGPLFDDVHTLAALFAELLPARKAVAGLPAASLLCEARAWFVAERGTRLAARNLMSHDQAVERLAAALANPAAVAAIQQRWKAALVDEFQDTDSLQWQVVRTLFGKRTLALVGDPKQAIYGFRGGDVYAWRDAVSRAHAPTLQLATSYRAGRGMSTAINALFDVPVAFVEDGFDYTSVASAERVQQRAVLRDGQALPALQLWSFAPVDVGQPEGKPASKERAEAGIQAACVAWIAGMLAAPDVRLRDARGDARPLQARHIAVLVNDNRQAHAMQAALGRAGVPASSNLRASVYASDEAGDLALLLGTLAAPDDPRRARAAMASVLAGFDANAIAATVDGPDAQAALLERSTGWAADAAGRGPLAWLHDLVAAAGPRLRALADGERRLANYLQLAELLQALHAQSFGLGNLAARFARARVEANDEADAARLRLDTDADAVTVSTLHAAKGLEYDVVLVPYAVLARDPAAHREPVPLYWHHAADNQARVAIGEGSGPADIQRATTEIRAEAVRKLYVAVTRARALCVLPWGQVTCTPFGALFHLLHEAGRALPLPATVEGCAQALHELCEAARGAAAIVAMTAIAAPPRRQSGARPTPLRAREFARTDLERDWQTWSFSRLVRGNSNAAAGDPLPGSGDADAPSVESGSATSEPGLAGARFGTAVHAAFEHADFAAWRDATDVPDGERDAIERALRAQGLAEGDAAMRRAIDVVGACLRDALNATLPCKARLCDVVPAARKAEIEFHLALGPARSADLFALLHAHGYQRHRNGVTPHMLHGLLTGKIDLTFRHADRYWIVDWKTNRCPPYDPASLQDEIARHDYDLQWLVYTLALHRWLGATLADYDYERDFGGVYYLFVRGMQDGHGVYADRPPRALIDALDDLFPSPRREAA
ncbi:MAG TPA: UvrD-helicase domain-containing protein [Rhodanobacteraceae bacterium]|nr:UvrD-helicase domain-containing protein [Rhodanobacteraceae bacterium]